MRYYLLLLVFISGMAYGKNLQKQIVIDEVKVVRMFEPNDEEIIILKIDSVLFLVPAMKMQSLINASKGIKSFSVYRKGMEKFEELLELSGVKDVEIVSSMEIMIDENSILPEDYAKYLK